MLKVFFVINWTDLLPKNIDLGELAGDLCSTLHL